MPENENETHYDHYDIEDYAYRFFFEFGKRYNIITQDSRVMDLAAGSAGFLIAAMKLMIAKAVFVFLTMRIYT